MSAAAKLVPCPYPFCKGKKVTPYKCKQHTERFIRPSDRNAVNRPLNRPTSGSGESVLAQCQCGVKLAIESSEPVQIAGAYSR